ncbi:MAG: homocysteine S-methyltransferase family protein [Eubacteriales bacterium]
MEQLFQNEFIILDGAMGTMLQKSGLQLGERPEELNLTNPELIKSIHRAYLTAGSQIVYANTFGANRHKLEGTNLDLREIITNAVTIAKEEAKQFHAYVALDLGPIGELLEPSGTLTFEEAYEIFKEVVLIGVLAGVDLVVIETMTDLYEVKAAVLAVKENSELPVFVTMTFEENGRTFTGCGLENIAITLTGLGVDALGLNCSLGPVEILPLIKELATYTNLPLIAKPNAGLPDPETGLYNMGAEEFARVMKEYAAVGVKILGGCCGTDEQYIANLKNELEGVKCLERTYEPKTKFCSATEVVVCDTVRVIGERINPTGKKRFVKALQEQDMTYILTQAIEQVEAGADLLDVNVGAPGLNEAELMETVVKAIQSVVSTPLQIDSSKYEGLESGLRVYNGKPILNSVNGEEEKLEQILPLAKKYGAAIVCLTIDEEGIPKTAQKRFDIANKILHKALSYGIPKEDVLVDCLTLTVSAQQKDCMETLQAMSRIKAELGLELVLGVSNISFGIPNRMLMNHSFLTLAMAHGLTLPILNPNTASMMDAIYAYRVLSGYDVDCEEYVERYGDLPNTSGTITKDLNDGITVPNGNHNRHKIASNVSNSTTIQEAILRGLDEQVVLLAKDLLGKKTPLEIVNETLIPTLDIIGKKYEVGEIFLPQLIRSAKSSCKAFDLIKEEIAKTNEESILKGRIILATVQGDIHDIGKNIVKVVLENYGYDIIDLGKDVKPEKVVQTAIEKNVTLIGLSALMTTTVESMKLTIEELRKSGHPCKIMVGGAVLTPEYAKKIGADFYAKDAKQSVEIAREVLDAY